ncbi:RNA-directed DNA polymerase, eukaryota, reverse transcriptase zinc-binding domain protein [Tanacetum coccineum]
MVKEINDKEVEALFDIDGDKALGPDGFSSELFKKAWDVIGVDFCLAVKEFFRNGKLLGEINATIIALIPKVSTTNKVSEFRPIACYNVLCKCISKILKNKIKCGLDKIVHINQSAFIPGRHIQDNILIAQELLRGYNIRNGPRRCAMQIDIQKAYDTVNWIFMENILIRFRFHNTMVKRIMQCITSSKFSICLNGGIQGYFKGGKGLRQGDHISPYLFTLIMEVFHMIMIKNIVGCKEFGYHFGCKELNLSNICFADDLLVLCKGNKESLQVIKQSLDEFSQVSRLTANLGKSVIFFGGIKEEERKDLLQILPFKCGKLPWDVNGPLGNFITQRNIYDAKLALDAKISEMINDNNWKCPIEWFNKFPELQSISNPPNLTDKEDRVLWITNAGNKVYFTTKQTWLDLRDELPIVSWRKVTHMITYFFQCDYAGKVWKEMVKFSHKFGSLSKLEDLINELAGRHVEIKFGNVIDKLILAATVYYVWQERNRRIFKDEKRTVDKLCKIIKDYVRCKLVSIQVKNSKNVKVMIKKWELKWNNGNLYDDIID